MHLLPNEDTLLPYHQHLKRILIVSYTYQSHLLHIEFESWHDLYLHVLYNKPLLSDNLLPF